MRRRCIGQLFVQLSSWRTLGFPTGIRKARWSIGRRSKVCTFLIVLAWIVLYSPGTASVTRAANITYVYDSAGRLIAVVDGSGNAASYVYDPVGNVTNISTTNASSVSVFDIDPGNGPTGTQVTIYGDGFSTTPSQNSISFAGASPVTPSSATQTALVVTVPSNAITGSVVVATGGKSSQPFSFTVTAQ